MTRSDRLISELVAYNRGHENRWRERDWSSFAKMAVLIAACVVAALAVRG